MCLFCPNTPVDRETLEKSSRNEKYGPFLGNNETFDITMCQAPCKEPLCCFISGCPVTGLCVQIAMRKKVLEHVNPGSGWDNYICCQGYFGGCCCIQPGKLGESSCPSCCMFLEACCCPGLAVSATRFVIMERYSLGLDEGDVRLIHFNNCLQCCLCIAHVVDAIVDTPATQCCETVLEIVSCVVYQCIQGCMIAQTNREIQLKEDGTKSAPGGIVMER
mmetsp:Transcript_11367/g.17063  ORF Transcript_11367/g.17063 Transcript_11367/m.17063 type:complete len:219 (-) Transcript_11367:393-1049(-)